MRWWGPILFALALGAVVGLSGALLWQHDSQPGDSVSAEAPATERSLQEPIPPPTVEPGGANPEALANITHTRQNAITRAAAEVGPDVVTISVIQTRIVRGNLGFESFFSQYLLPRYYREQVRSMGSGIILSSDGYIVTNDHVVQDADSIQVTLSDGRTFSAKLMGSDRESDLAVLKVDATDLPAARLGNSDSLLIGEWAIALGNPFGHLLEDPHPTVTVGVISALNRDVKRPADDDRVYRKVIQTDAAINPGNSGGPLVNADGEVVGINSFIFSSSHGSEGIGFAIPINQARVVVNDLIRYGEVRPAWVGVGIQPVPGSSDGSANLNPVRGVMVTTVQKDSPADHSGLKVNDIIRRAGGHPVASVADWDGIASFWRPRDTVSLEVIREGRARSTRLSLVARPLDRARAVSVGFGLWIADIDAEVASQLGARDRSGVVVTRVEPESQGEAHGFDRGDIIRELGDRRIGSVDDFQSVLRSGRPGTRLLVKLEREGKLYLTALDLR